MIDSDWADSLIDLQERFNKLKVSGSPMEDDYTALLRLAQDTNLLIENNKGIEVLPVFLEKVRGYIRGLLALSAKDNPDIITCFVLDLHRSLRLIGEVKKILEKGPKALIASRNEGNLIVTLREIERIVNMFVGIYMNVSEFTDNPFNLDLGNKVLDSHNELIIMIRNIKGGKDGASSRNVR